MDLDFARLSPEETENRKQSTYPQKESHPKIATMERPLSPISEDTYVEDIEPGKSFQDD